MGVLAADGATVSLYFHGGETAAAKDAIVSPSHLLIADVQGFFVGIETVEIHHREFPNAQQTSTRSRFVTELGLNLVYELGQIAIALDVMTHQFSDDFLMRGTETELTIAAVGQGEQTFAESQMSAGFLPEIERLQGRHGHFLPSHPGHLFPDYLLQLVQRPPSQRKVGIYAGSHLMYHARPGEQLVTDGVRVRRRLAQRLGEKLRHTHSRILA